MTLYQAGSYKSLCEVLGLLLLSLDFGKLLTGSRKILDFPGYSEENKTGDA